MKLIKYGHIARAAKVIASLLHGDAEDITDAMQRMETHRSAGTLHALNIAMVLQAQPDIHIWEGDYNDWHITKKNER